MSAAEFLDAAEAERMIKQVLRSAPPRGYSEEELLAAVDEANQMITAGVVMELWRSGQLDVSYDGEHLKFGATTGEGVAP